MPSFINTLRLEKILEPAELEAGAAEPPESEAGTSDTVPDTRNNVSISPEVSMMVSSPELDEVEFKKTFGFVVSVLEVALLPPVALPPYELKSKK